MAPWPERQERPESWSGPPLSQWAGQQPSSAPAAAPDSASRDLRDLIVANCTAYLMEARAGPDSSDTKQQHEQEKADTAALDEFQIIKAVVLGLVTSIILLSICKMVFQLFVRYAGKADDR